MRHLASPWGVALVLALSLLQQSLGHLNGDVSWLITVCEHLLEGGVAYVDMLETNPPAAWLIYMPAVWIAHLLGLAPEPVVAASVFAFGLLCLHLIQRVLKMPDASRMVVMNGLAALLLFMPGFSFGEREHVAVMAALPLLCLWSIQQDQPVSVVLRLLSAALAALTVIIKPHFALVIGLPLLWSVWRQKRLGLLVSLEPIIIASLALAYLALVILHYPAFFDVLPALLATYVPIRASLVEVLTNGWFIAHLLLSLFILRSAWLASLPHLVWHLWLASLGFQFAYLMQMKGWTNHGLPGVTLAAAAALVVMLRHWNCAVSDPRAETSRRALLMGALPAGIYLLTLFGAGLQFAGFEPHRGLTQAVRAALPASPKIISLTAALDVGHPVTRAVGGRWVGRAHSRWMAIYARVLVYKGAANWEQLERLREVDVAIFAEDVTRQRPDLILIDDDGYTEELLLHPAVRAVLRPYEPVGYASGITIWRLSALGVEQDQGGQGAGRAS